MKDDKYSGAHYIIIERDKEFIVRRINPVGCSYNRAYFKTRKAAEKFVAGKNQLELGLAI